MQIRSVTPPDMWIRSTKFRGHVKWSNQLDRFEGNDRPRLRINSSPIEYRNAELASEIKFRLSGCHQIGWVSDGTTVCTPVVEMSTLSAISGTRISLIVLAMFPFTDCYGSCDQSIASAKGACHQGKINPFLSTSLKGEQRIPNSSSILNTLDRKLELMSQ